MIRHLVGKALEDKFWSKVNKTDTCWLWTGGNRGNGYGIMTVNYVLKSAHRLAWEFTYGEIPGGLQVNHKCDVRLCVRPSHLYLGTQRQNLIDARERGRLKDRSGENNGTSKLTDGDVVKIRELYKDGNRVEDLSKKFRVAMSTIYSVVSGRRWTHIRG